jgi:hypothetical protein
VALDTAQKRFAAINVGCPWRGARVLPDGDIDQGDRQAIAFMASAPLAEEFVPPVVEEFPHAAGGVWMSDEPASEQWKKRRKKAEELEEAIRRAAGLIPPSAPEGQLVREEVKKASTIVEAVPRAKWWRAAPKPEAIDLRPLIEAAQRVDRAIKDYKARIAEEKRRQEEDDEDILLLLDD